MKKLLIASLIAVSSAYLCGAASGSAGGSEDYFLLNDTDKSIRLRIRTGGDTSLEHQKKLHLMQLAQPSLSQEERENLQNNLGSITEKLASKTPISVILPENKSLVENREFFLLEPKTSVTFAYNPVAGGPLRIRAWPRDTQPTPDIDADGQPTETSAANSLISLFAYAPGVSPRIRGFVLSSKALAPIILNAASKELKSGFFATPSSFNLQDTTSTLSTFNNLGSRTTYTNFGAAAETYAPIPRPSERYTHFGQ